MGGNWKWERQREEGRWHLWAQSPERQAAGIGRVGVWVAPVLGLLQSWPPPQVSRAVCQITTEEMWDKGGGGEGGGGVWTNRHIHDRCLFRKIQESRHANITGVCFLTPLAPPPACSPLFCQCGVRKGLGAGLGEVEGGLLCISMLAPSPPLPRRTVLSLQMSPPK